jgi:DNA-binding response OmpR family regulator
VVPLRLGVPDADRRLGPERPAAAIVDLGPPLAASLRLTRRLKREQVPTVLLTSGEPPACRGSARLTCLTKPFRPSEVRRRLASVAG